MNTLYLKRLCQITGLKIRAQVNLKIPTETTLFSVRKIHFSPLCWRQEFCSRQANGQIVVKFNQKWEDDRTLQITSVQLRGIRSDRSLSYSFWFEVQKNGKKKETSLFQYKLPWRSLKVI